MYLHAKRFEFRSHGHAVCFVLVASRLMEFLMAMSDVNKLKSRGHCGYCTAYFTFGICLNGKIMTS